MPSEFLSDNCMKDDSNVRFVMSNFFQVYKRKNEVAKKEYLKALAAYRASQISEVIIF